MTTWVLLRGLAREARHWGEFKAQFGAELGLNADDILTPDLPGNGRRYAETSPTWVEAIVDAVRTELLALGKAPPYYLLALSLGGMVAVAWARRYPEECELAVLVNSSLRPYSPFYRRLRPSAYATMFNLLFANHAARESAILKLTSARAAVLQDIVPSWVAFQRECPVSASNSLRQLLAAARFSAPDKPELPLLILAAASDRLVDPSCSQRLAQAWHADFVLHPSAGHDLPLDDGAWLARQVQEWLGKKMRPEGRKSLTD